MRFFLRTQLSPRAGSKSAGQNTLLQPGSIDENVGLVHEIAGIVQSSEESLN